MCIPWDETFYIIPITFDLVTLTSNFESHTLNVAIHIWLPLGELRCLLTTLVETYDMSNCFKPCVECNREMNVLDDHEKCYRHRLCVKEFPCSVCKLWSDEKWVTVSRMIDKAHESASKNRQPLRALQRTATQFPLWDTLLQCPKLPLWESECRKLSLRGLEKGQQKLFSALSDKGKKGASDEVNTETGESATYVRPFP